MFKAMARFVSIRSKQGHSRKGVMKVSVIFYENSARDVQITQSHVHEAGPSPEVKYQQSSMRNVESSRNRPPGPLKQ